MLIELSRDGVFWLMTLIDSSNPVQSVAFLRYGVLRYPVAHMLHIATIQWRGNRRYQDWLPVGAEYAYAAHGCAADTPQVAASRAVRLVRADGYYSGDPRSLRLFRYRQPYMVSAYTLEKVEC